MAIPMPPGRACIITAGRGCASCPGIMGLAIVAMPGRWAAGGGVTIVARGDATPGEGIVGAKAVAAGHMLVASQEAMYFSRLPLGSVPSDLKFWNTYRRLGVGNLSMITLVFAASRPHLVTKRVSSARHCDRHERPHPTHRS